MPPLLFPLPTTQLLSLGGNTFIDPSSTHTTQLADATQTRTKFQIALKSYVDQTPGSSALQVVDAILDYLPYISGISTCLDTDELLWKSDPSFPWKPSLTHYISTPILNFPSLHAEHLFALLTYTLSLSNYAHSILATLPTPTGHITTDEEKRITTGLAKAVDLLCQAAGVAEWTAENVCPLVESTRNASGRLGGKYRWPVETGSEAFRGVAMTLIADAHITAIRKLLLPVQPYMMFAPPGPPLPSNHPSPSLLAKLYLHVSSLYISASGLLRSHVDKPRKSKSNTQGDEGVDGEIIPELKRYLHKESLLASALAYKWLGIDVGENPKSPKVGEAITWLKESQMRLSELEDGKMREKMKTLTFGKGSEKKKEERKARKGRVERELDDVSAWLKSYIRLNDTVIFQPVPPVSSLIIPSGRPIFASKTFKPPASKMGHESKEDQSDEYAGKGSYY